MTSRKAADEGERPNKRPRLDDDASDNAPPGPSLDDLNGDCLLHILSYLHFDDLNSIAICSRRYRTARAHESLDQTRTGTIIISEHNRTCASFFNRVTSNGWNEVFQGNQTHLKIDGLENLLRGEERMKELKALGVASQFARVTSLKLEARSNGIRYEDIWPLCHAFPNLRQLNMTSLPLSSDDAPYICDCFCKCCPNLARLTWNGCRGHHHLFGRSFRSASNLTELFLDDGRFFADDNHMSALSGAAHDRNYIFMFRRCQSLTRLSIKNASCRIEDFQDIIFQPVPQEMLIKMVRLHPTLRWLRSDLTPENVTMLKQERPEITFVID